MTCTIKYRPTGTPQFYINTIESFTPKDKKINISPRLKSASNIVAIYIIYASLRRRARKIVRISLISVPNLFASFF